MTKWRRIILKLNAWGEPLERFLYELRPAFFLVLGLAAIFMLERDLVATVVGATLIFVGGYALKARFDFRKKRTSE